MQPTAISFEQLCAGANRAERVAARLLVRKTGMDEALALTQTMSAPAGTQGLAQLLADRSAAQLRQAARLAERRQARQAQRSAKLAAQQAPAGCWQAWFDGSARPNPGACRIACVLRGPDGEHFTHAENTGHGSSSDAEYCALIAALELALAQCAQDLIVYGDSRVVIDDVQANVQANKSGAAVLSAHRRRARALLAQFEQIRLRWIPRHKNAEADALTQSD
ncbi:MAG: reverse transcriptase-like protein [Burkholderiales bacterium]|nr:reverse transcriptase-like protein [Burkholderiales bacterium]